METGDDLSDMAKQKMRDAKDYADEKKKAA
jgi:hypothetical protein